ncbi:hypothetical protein IWQ49_004409 [Labrenzia sp. EL_126]|nr:hypothetical protein [Labrenzia sp. EL_126]
MMFVAANTVHETALLLSSADLVLSRLFRSMLG